MNSAPIRSVRVLCLCTGLGTINRGIESFFREAFDGLKSTQGLELRLMKAAGPQSYDERVMWNLPRTGRLARLIGALARRNGYVVEQWTSVFSALAEILDFRPHVVFYSDANLGFLLFWLRNWFGLRYKMLFSNGGPVHPPFIRTDYVHQVAPCYYQEALQSNEPAEKHFLVPYGIRVPSSPLTSSIVRSAIREKLRLPQDRKVILSVGWIRSTHKRMDYLISEVARLPEPRPFLQLVGAVDEGSRDILDLGRRRLGSEHFGAASVSYESVADFYRAADCFVLASVQEGFGRVYLEALSHGLIVIAHRSAVTDYVLGPYGTRVDLTRTGALGQALCNELSKPSDAQQSLARWRYVRSRFSWTVLASSYLRMFKDCALGKQAENQRRRGAGKETDTRSFETAPSPALGVQAPWP